MINFVDFDNFLLFTLDQKSSRFKGYELSIIDFQGGETERYLTERYDEPPKSLSTFEVLSSDESLHFFFDEQEIYRLEDREFKVGAKIGLYSQKNSDAIFEELVLFESHPTGDEKEPEPLLPSPALEPTHASPLTAGDLDDLLNKLTIRIPESRTPIHFSNVVPMEYDIAEILRRNLTKKEIKVGPFLITNLLHYLTID